MKQVINNLLCIIIGILIGVGIIRYSDLGKSPESSSVEVTHKIHSISGWDALTIAIMMTESGLDSTATNTSSSATGIMQLTPIYIDEVNRIVGAPIYKLSDAYSVSKTVEMFNLMQDRYNSDHDGDWAIHLHNPTAGLGYADKVWKNYRQVVKVSDVLEILNAK